MNAHKQNEPCGNAVWCGGVRGDQTAYFVVVCTIRYTPARLEYLTPPMAWLPTTCNGKKPLSHSPIQAISHRLISFIFFLMTIKSFHSNKYYFSFIWFHYYFIFINYYIEWNCLKVCSLFNKNDLVFQLSRLYLRTHTKLVRLLDLQI